MSYNYDPGNSYVGIYPEEVFRNGINETFTDTIKAGSQGTVNAEMTDHSTTGGDPMVVNEHTGRTFTNTSENITYTVVSNTADVLVLDTALSGTADTDACSLTSDASLWRVLAFDMTRQTNTDTEIPEPMKMTLEKWVMGEGRNVSRIVELGFNVGEGTHEFQVLTGIFLYYAFGACTTTGTALGTPFADTVASVAGQVVTMTTNVTMVADEHIGRMMESTSGDTSGDKWSIIDNDGTTLTLAGLVPANIAADGIKIEEEPFTHTITEADTLPSFALHYEFENTTSAESFRIDLLGCVIKSLELICEVGSETPVMMNIEILCAKEIAGQDIAKPSPIEQPYYVKDDMTTLTLTYNTAIEGNLKGDACDKISFKIINDVEIKHVFGDEYVNKAVVGKREYEISSHVMPKVRDWYDISRLKCPSYASQYGNSGYYAYALVFQQILRRATNDDIQIDMTKLHLIAEGYKPKIFNREAKILDTDIDFKCAPGGAGSCVVKDALNVEYYEHTRNN